jgi:hypothetical protein
MDIGKERVDCGPICFALQYRDIDGGAPHGQGAGSQGGNHADQGVCLQVVGVVDGAERELLRFECFDNHPHYHYDPAGKNVSVMLDPTVTGNPLRWAMSQLRWKLPAMLEHAGHGEAARGIDLLQLRSALDEVEAKASDMAIHLRRTVKHNRGTDIIEAGNIRFGLELRTAGGGDGGMAIHVLGDIAGQEIELLAFDCFRIYPHYHYGPRYKNERIYLDKTLVPDPFAWVLQQFKSGRLPAMLTRAGYPTVAAALDEGLVAGKLSEVEARAHAMLQAAA